MRKRERDENTLLRCYVCLDDTRYFIWYQCMRAFDECGYLYWKVKKKNNKIIEKNKIHFEMNGTNVDSTK